MAELGLAAVQTLLAALQCSQLEDICSMWGYKSQLQDLKDTVTTVNRVLKDAESKVLSCEQQGYVEELKDVVYEADNLFDEFTTLLELKELGDESPSKFDRLKKKVGRFFSSNENKLGQAYRMFRKVKDIQKRLNTIVDRHKRFRLTVDYKPICLRREDTCSYVHVKDIIGRDGDKKAVIERLLESKDQGVRFLAVVGVGGVGKTAIAQLVYNDDLIKKEFGDLMFWVCVSDQDKQQFDVKAILSKILKLARNDQTSFDASELELLQKQFQNVLGGKKYMLVLDDLWNEEKKKWEVLKKFLMVGQGGSRVLVTTRSQMTATIVADEAYIHKLERLSPEASWELFKVAAFKEGNNQPKELLEIGEKIVAKCFNIPLAIKVVGSLLYGQDISQWRLFEENDLANIKKCDNTGENEIMSVLKLSYHNLETSLKSCFTYCAVFPKDFGIKKEILINHWMAHGYIVFARGSQSIEDLAEEHFLILLRRCFFQDVEKDEYGDVKSVKIHDLMHDVAQEVAGKEIQILNNCDDKIGDAVYHLSFDGHCDLHRSSTRTKLRSYINVSDMSHRCSVAENLKYLRVLDAQKTEEVEKLLGSINQLLHLRYLDLSFSEVTKIPANSISKLHNLQALLLRRCYDLQKLPDDLNKLKKLRHLDIDECYRLSCMPSGMDKLTSLRVLTYFKVGGKDHLTGEQHGEEFKGLEALTNLKGHIFISIGIKYINVEQPTSGSYLSQIKDLNKVTIKFGNNCDDPEGSLEKLEPHPNLKVLVLWSYEGLTIPWWQQAKNNGSVYLNLVSIRILDCKNLQTIPSLSKLPCLKSLSLLRLGKLEYMEETSSIDLPFFPVLEFLVINDVQNLKGWFRKEDWADADHCWSRSFPRLSQLRIRRCDKLESFPPCPNVKTLTCDKSGILKQVVGEGNGTSCLDDLEIFGDEELKDLSELSNVFRRCGTSLRKLVIDICDEVESASEGLQHLTALETLEFRFSKRLNFSEVDILLHWKSFHQSLRTLTFEDLPKMTSLPKGMMHLTSLQELTIKTVCDSLLERCRKPDGEDWPQIKHIPTISLGPTAL